MHGHSKGAGIFSSKWGAKLKERIEAAKAKKAEKKDRGLGIKNKEKRAARKEARSTKRDERHEAKHQKRGERAFKKGGFKAFGKVAGRHGRRHPVKKD